MSIAAAPRPAATTEITTVAVDRLARAVGVPASVLSFLEGQFPEVRAIASPTGRAYRITDAALLAGLVEALYHEGRPFREVQGEARSGARTTLMRRGAALIGVDLAAARATRPSEPVPPDAIVRRKGPQPASAPRAAAPVGADEILAELMACVRILGAARRDDAAAAASTER
ncbi:MAG: hypothetical protein AcusKO_17190 [Acuticoccus sp.]